jgi:hypothetical protein
MYIEGLARDEHSFSLTGLCAERVLDYYFQNKVKEILFF